MKKNKLFLLSLSLTTALAFTACQAVDVAAKFAASSFEAVLNKIPDKIKSDDINNNWAIISPAGERFIWSKDFSTEGKPDAMLEFDAKPFIDAGLDINKLPKEMVAGNKIVYKAEFGNNKFSYTGEATPMDSFKQLIGTHRSIVGYHQALDHYGISLGDGNMFEWAKDINTNDKDIVFVLNPKPFIDAGLKPEMIQGWTFAKVEVMGKNGKTEQVDKLLKPFNLN